MMRKRTSSSLSGLAAVAVLVAGVIVGAHRTEESPNTALVGSAPAAAVVRPAG